ncbi:hypothetical protein DICVIV_07448 [Dictyocaulus viviparus]|uniref:ABC-2 type transporter transmembrane domain-containing protein n=1 Tax=Dictyocaulus viviparus TaxID=29172 RepID=A0A0D8XRW8_DICVI|nr:hypothetical protein DICVIV_07448 [Dictyocaulus viviparus]
MFTNSDKLEDEKLTLPPSLISSPSYLAACVFGSNAVATTYFPLIVSPLLAMTGFYIDPRTVPVYFQFIPPISWFRYAYEAHLVVLFHPLSEIKGCPSNKTFDAIVCSANDGDELLQTQGIDHTSLFSNIIILLIMTIIIRLLALLAFIIRIRKSGI